MSDVQEYEFSDGDLRLSVDRWGTILVFRVGYGTSDWVLPYEARVSESRVSKALAKELVRVLDQSKLGEIITDLRLLVNKHCPE